MAKITATGPKFSEILRACDQDLIQNLERTPGAVEFCLAFLTRFKYYDGHRPGANIKIAAKHALDDVTGRQPEAVPRPINRIKN